MFQPNDSTEPENKTPCGPTDRKSVQSGPQNIPAQTKPKRHQQINPDASTWISKALEIFTFEFNRQDNVVENFNPGLRDIQNAEPSVNNPSGSGGANVPRASQGDGACLEPLKKLDYLLDVETSAPQRKAGSTDCKSAPKLLASQCDAPAPLQKSEKPETSNDRKSVQSAPQTIQVQTIPKGPRQSNPDATTWGNKAVDRFTCEFNRQDKADLDFNPRIRDIQNQDNGTCFEPVYRSSEDSEAKTTIPGDLETLEIVPQTAGLSVNNQSGSVGAVTAQQAGGNNGACVEHVARISEETDHRNYAGGRIKISVDIELGNKLEYLIDLGDSGPQQRISGSTDCTPAPKLRTTQSAAPAPQRKSEKPETSNDRKSIESAPQTMEVQTIPKGRRQSNPDAETSIPNSLEMPISEFNQDDKVDEDFNSDIRDPQKPRPSDNNQSESGGAVNVPRASRGDEAQNLGPSDNNQSENGEAVNGPQGNGSDKEGSKPKATSSEDTDRLNDDGKNKKDDLLNEAASVPKRKSGSTNRKSGSDAEEDSSPGTTNAQNPEPSVNNQSGSGEVDYVPKSNGSDEASFEPVDSSNDRKSVESAPQRIQVQTIPKGYRQSNPDARTSISKGAELSTFESNLKNNPNEVTKASGIDGPCFKPMDRIGEDSDLCLYAGRNKLDYFLDVLTGGDNIPGNLCECLDTRYISEDDSDIVWEIINFLADEATKGATVVGQYLKTRMPSIMKDACGMESSGENDNPSVESNGQGASKSEDSDEKRVSNSENKRASNSKDKRVSNSEDKRVSNSADSEDKRVSNSENSEDKRVSNSENSEDKRASNSENKRASNSEDKRASNSEDKRASSSEDKRASNSEDKRASNSDEKRASNSEDKRASNSKDKRASNSEEKRTSNSEDKRASNSDDKRASNSDDKRASNSDDKRASNSDDKRASNSDDKRASNSDDKRASNSDDKRASNSEDNEPETAPEIEIVESEASEMSEMSEMSNFENDEEDE